IEVGKERSRTTSGPALSLSPTLGTAPAQDSHGRSSKRTRVSPEIWHDTLSLLCDADYAVRADYAEALVFYLRTEIRKRGDFADTDGVKRIRPLAEGPIQQATSMKLLIHGDSAAAEAPSVNILPATPTTGTPTYGGSPENPDLSPQLQRQPRRSMINPI